MLDDLVEHRGRVELGCEGAARSRQLLRERTRRAFPFEQAAPLERSACSTCEVARELDVLVAQRALVGEEDEHEPRRILARDLERDEQQRAKLALLRERAPPAVEAVVRRELGGRKDATFLRGVPEPGLAVEPGLERSRERRGELVPAREAKRPCARHHDGGERGAERLTCRLGDGVQRRGERERLDEHGGDAVEAALDPRLARALLERLGVAQCQRCERCERLEQLEPLLVEALRGPRAHAEHPSHLVEDRDRRDHHVFELAIARRRKRLLRSREVALQNRSPRRDRFAERPSGEDLSPRLALGQAVHGTTHERVPALVEEPAVRGIRAEQLHDLAHEHLEDSLKLELAGQRLRRVQESGLPQQAKLVIREQPRRVETEPELARDRLEERNVRGRPRSRHVPVDRQHADQPVEDDDRRREDRRASRARAGPGVRLCAASVELRCRGDVGERDGRAIPHREVGDREAREAQVADRLEPVGVPLRLHRHRAVRAHPAGRSNVADTQRFRHDGNRMLEHCIEVGVSPHSSGELRDDQLAIAIRVPQPLDHRSRFPRERLELGENVTRERALLGRRRDYEHSDHALVRDQRDVREASRSGSLYEPCAHALRGPRVVDRERRSAVIRARDSGRLVRQVETNVGEPRDVFAAIRRDDAVSLGTGRFDEHERGELRASHRRRALDELVRRLLDRGGVAQAPGGAREGRSGNSSVRSRNRANRTSAGTSATRVAANPGQPEPPMGSRSRSTSSPKTIAATPLQGKTRARASSGPRTVLRGAPGRQATRTPPRRGTRPRARVGDSVQPDGLLLGCHWAFLADSREASADFPPARLSPAASKDGPNGPLWPGSPKASLDATGRCEPRLSGFETAVSTLKRPAAPTPPKQPAFSCP